MLSANYYLTLGHTPALSLLELTSLGFDPRPLTAQLVAIADPEILEITNRLGGTTRMMESVQPTTPASLLSDLNILISASSGKNFALSNYSSLPLPPSNLSKLKSNLSRPVRFLSFDTTGHSLIALRKQHVTEFSIIDDQAQLVIARTVWIQDADDWSRRDRSRPYQDIKRGMLPPKIARIMVNLAAQGKGHCTLLDPFCGTGTILMEGILSGLSVIGSDHDPAAVQGTERNLTWLASKYKLANTNYKLLTIDATHINESIKSIDIIVTEPYLGPLLDAKHLPPPAKLKNIARGLDKLYRGSLRAWHPLLSPGGRVVIIIPSFALGEDLLPTLQIDTMQSLGYNYLDSVAYSKPGAIVIRNITILEKSD